MGEVKKAEIGVPSASAFVEGGIQDSCDDACSICLDDFSNSDPSTVTNCKHEFHLHCILEWCQRSSNCPMCWQSLSLKDPSSQELLVALEKERSVISIPSRHATIFHHPVFGAFEIQHLPGRMIDAELEEQIMQHLAAAAEMRRSHRNNRRESSRSRSSAHARTENTDASSASTEETSESPLPVSSSTEGNRISFSSFESPATPSTSQGITNDNRSYSSESSSQNTDGAGSSDSQSSSDTWRSRLSSVSMKYKESISRSAIGWKDKLFSRSSSMADIGSEVRREINAGISTVSRMMERIDTRNNNGENSGVDSSVMGHSNHDNRDSRHETPSTSAG